MRIRTEITSVPIPKLIINAFIVIIISEIPVIINDIE